MKKPMVPENESERVQELESYAVLDTGPEAIFDDITRLASAICGTPIALISLVDGTRQWFKSSYGLSATETSRDVSFCGHAILQKDLFEVSDSLNDDRFKDNPLVHGAPHVRFYAGAPLISPNGYSIGTLCVIGEEPKRLSQEQKTSLQALARHVMSLFEHRRLNAQLLESVIRHIPVGLMIKHAQDLRYQLWNHQATELFGVRGDNAIGKRDHGLVDARIADVLESLDRHVMKTGRLRRVDVKVQSQGHAARHVRLTKVPVQVEGAENQKHVLTIADDRTEDVLLRESLQSSRDLFRSLFDHAPIGMVVLNDKLGVSMANESFKKILGLEPSEDVPARLLDAVSPEYRSEVENWLTEAVRGASILQEIQTSFDRAGSAHQRWVSLHVVCEKLGPTQERALIVTVQDLTDFRIQESALASLSEDQKVVRNELWQNNEIRRAILESTDYLVIATDPTGLITLFNKRAEEATGYRADEMVGIQTPQVLHLSDELEARASLSLYESGKGCSSHFDVIARSAKISGKAETSEWTYVRRDGSDFPIRLSISCLYGQSGDLVGYLCVGQDITEDKKMKDQLLEATHSAHHAAKIKAQFLANMSHEIRTPMNGVIGVCNLLIDEVKQPEIVDKLMIIKNCGHSLLEIINDILDYSKLEAGKIEIDDEAFPVHRVVLELVELLSSRASEKGLVLAYEPEAGVPDWIMGDSTRLRQILTNLIGNAIKFTETGSVRILSRARPKSDGKIQIEFSIVDTGIGIPPQTQAKLFEVFAQGDASTTKRFGGTGLGLAICRQLTLRMGGEISVESEVGKGSTFRFTILTVPAAAPSAGAETNPFESYRSEWGSANKLRILIAEDNRVNQLVAQGLLQKLGHTADLVSNGREALMALQNKTYDLILMDCHMPVLDGFEATKRIRQRLTKDERPQIVALTASTMREDVERCAESGMDAFLSKPVSITDLVQVLKKVQEIVSQRAQKTKAS